MTASETGAVRVIDSAIGCPNIPIVQGSGNAQAVVWPGNGAQFRTFHVVSLEPGASTIELRHPSDCVYYVAEGGGSVQGGGADERFDLIQGSMVHIDAGDAYRIAAGEAGVKVIGGPCPADMALYAGLLPSGLLAQDGAR